MAVNNTKHKTLITGTSSADSILNYGGKVTISTGNGNDTVENIREYTYDDYDKEIYSSNRVSINTGAGNDKLWGDAGADTFIYSDGEGKDIIYGFENNDLLQITGTFSGTYSKSKNEVYFKVGTTTNAITLKDFGSTSTVQIIKSMAPNSLKNKF